MALEAQSAEKSDKEAEQTDILEAREWAYFLLKYQWFNFKTRDGLPYFMLSPYAYHKAMIFQPEATNNQCPKLVMCSDTRYTPS